MGVRLTVSDRRADPGQARGAGDAGPSEVPWEFDQDRIVLGRAASADVVLPHRSVSLRHATLRLEGGRYTLVDHGSTNGTRVNGQRLVAERPKPLRDGDRVELGVFAVRFHSGIAVALPASGDRTASLARRLVRLRGSDEDAPRAARRLVVLNGPRTGHALTLPEPPARVVIGRAEGCDLSIPDADASREHAEVRLDLDGALVRDLGAKNALVVNERRAIEKRLRDRDELTIGATVIAYEDPEDAALRALESEADELLEPEPEVPLPPPVVAAPSPAEDPDAPTGEPEHAPPPPPAPRRGPSAPELAIYLLAALVLAASLAGLAWLVGTR